MGKNITFGNNICLLEEYYPTYAKKLQNLDISSKKYILETTRENFKTLKISNENKCTFLHSKYYPMIEAGEWIDKNMDPQSEFHIFFGFGSGYYLKDLLNKIKQNYKVIVFEADIGIFNAALNNVEMEGIINNSNVNIFIEDFTEFKKYLKANIKYNSIEKISTYVLPNYNILFPSELTEFNQILKDIRLDNIMEKNTAKVFSKVWQENLLKNMVHLFDSCLFNEFENKFKNIPFIIVSAGPSLNKNVSMLKDVKGRAIIICVGRALKVLLQEGIKPDIVAAIDGSELSAQQFEGLEYSDIALLYTARIHSSILEKHKGHKILIPNVEPFIETSLKGMGVNYRDISCGNSVATMAFSFACYAGADPIVFVGQDLAYKGNETHANGTYYGNSNDIDVNKMLIQKVKGIHGEELTTGADFYFFLKWFENAIANDNTGRAYINSTAEGANINGTIIKPLNQVINEYCVNNEVKHMINNVLENKRKYDDKSIQEFIFTLEQASINMDEVVHLCKKALRYNDELYKIYKFNLGKNVNPITKKMDKIDELILAKKSEFSLLEHIMRPIYDNVISQKQLPDNSDEYERAMYATTLGKSFYESICNEIIHYKPLLTELIQQMKIKYPN